MQVRRLALVAAAGFTSIALMGAPALAKNGGGGGGGQPTPPPTSPPVSLCPEYAQGGGFILADGSVLFGGDIYDAACLVSRLSPGGGLSIYELIVAPGWVADTKSSGGGSSNRIAVDFNNPTTRQKHSVVIEPGKTDIR